VCASLAALLHLDDGHLVPVLFVSADRLANRAAHQHGHAGHQREIFLLQRPLRKLLRETPVRLVGLRHEDDPGGFAVEAMDDARPLDAANAAQSAAAVREERVHHRVFAGARARVHDHPRGLVHGQQVFVLEKSPRAECPRPSVPPASCRETKT